MKTSARAYYPSRAALLLLSVPVLLSFILIYDDRYAFALYALDACICVLFIADALLSRIPSRAIHIDIQMSHTWSLQRQEEVTIELTCASTDISGRLRLDLPPFLHAEPHAVPFHVTRQQSAHVTFRARSERRGRYTLAGIHLETKSRTGLWVIHQLLPQEHAIHVYPDVKQMQEYALLARTNRLSLIGIRTLAASGGDTEFQRLREYQSDDPIQRIDWKATARRDALTVREYQPNQSQSIMLMIDAGRMMVSTATAGDGTTQSLLDHAINASLMLAYVALQQGDRVGVIVYANGIQRFIAARSGERHIHRIIHALHDIHATLVESRHEDAFLYVQKMERKRSLVVTFTHVLDDVNALHIEQHCQNLLGRHLPMAVLLRDHDIHTYLEKPLQTTSDMWNAVAAAHICNWRSSLIERLRMNGSLVIDCAPHDLHAGVISQYLKIKAQHLL